MIMITRTFDIVATRLAAPYASECKRTVDEIDNVVMSAPVPLISFLSLLCGMDRHQVREVLMDGGMVSGGITDLQFITVDSRPTTAVLLEALSAALRWPVGMTTAKLTQLSQ
jgi:hypothetical protein